MNPPEDPQFQHYIGKHLLVGITRMNADGSVREMVQLHGTIISIDDECVTMRKHDSEEICTFPPQPELFEEADPGEYRLRATGEVVVDPDLLASWTVRPPASHDCEDEDDDLQE